MSLRGFEIRDLFQQADVVCFLIFAIDTTHQTLTHGARIRAEVPASVSWYKPSAIEARLPRTPGLACRQRCSRRARIQSGRAMRTTVALVLESHTAGEGWAEQGPAVYLTAKACFYGHGIWYNIKPMEGLLWKWYEMRLFGIRYTYLLSTFITLVLFLTHIINYSLLAVRTI